MSGLKIIYFDPESTGYHPGHVRIFCDRVSSDRRVSSLHFILGEGFSEFPELMETIGRQEKTSFEYCSSKVTNALLPTSPSSGRQKGLVRWSEVRRALRERPGSIFFDSMLDRTLTAALLDRLPVPGIVTGIVHFCASAIFAPSLVERLKLKLIFLLSRRSGVPTVLTFDKLFMKMGPSLITKHWRAVPDPLPISSEQFRNLTSGSRNEEGGRIEFLLFGSLGRRKGVFSLVEALFQLDAATKARIRVRIIGKYSEGGSDERARFVELIKALQEDRELEIIFDEHFADEDELVVALKSCDVVLAPYLAHPGVSSIVVWASAAGKPIITQNSGWLGHVTKSFELGICCDTNAPASLAAAIASITSQLGDFPADELRNFSKGHTADEFYDAVITELAYLDT